MRGFLSEALRDVIIGVIVAVAVDAIKAFLRWLQRR